MSSVTEHSQASFYMYLCCRLVEKLDPSGQHCNDPSLEVSRLLSSTASLSLSALYLHWHHQPLDKVVLLLALPTKAIDLCKPFVFLSFLIDQFKISDSGPGCSASLNNLGEDVELQTTH